MRKAVPAEPVIFKVTEEQTAPYLPVFENIPAGFPSPATDFLSDTISLDQYLIRSPNRTVLLRVTGDSMKDAGILAGDLVIVERRPDAVPGQIVVANVDGNYTIKYLGKDDQGYYLQAANKKYGIIRPQNDFSMFGVVTGVVRKYGNH